jgi:putative ATPase
VAIFEKKPHAPLAERCGRARSTRWSGRHLLGPGKPLRLAFESAAALDDPVGPPGVGKTTLARLMAERLRRRVHRLSAVFSGVKDIREAVQRAELTLAQNGRHTILFVDEVHRFNKAQQDAFLPYVEQGLVTFIGATTENPSFEVNGALLSRAAVYVLKSLDEAELGELFERARARPFPTWNSTRRRRAPGRPRRRRRAPPAEPAGDRYRGAADLRIAVPWTRLSRQVRWRRTCAASTRAARPSTTRSRPCTSRCAAPIPTPRSTGCAHARRRRRSALPRPAHRAHGGEDIGLADPRALQIALNAVETYERLGSPEGELALAEAVIFMACAAKSNAVYVAYNSARKFVAEDGSREVPLHLRNAPTKLMKELGYGRNTATRTTSRRPMRRARTTSPRACRS